MLGERLGLMIGVGFAVMLFVVLPSWAIWHRYVYQQSDEYVSPAVRRYAAFREEIQGCTVERSVFSTRADGVPAFVQADCGERGEVVWSHKVKTITKVAEGTWLLGAESDD